MDDSKRVKFLKPDPKTKKLDLIQTYELPKIDKEKLDQTPFDEYAVSAGVLHWNDRAIPLLASKAQDNPTWASIDVMLKNYDQL